MELVASEPPKKSEQATQETITSIVDRIGVIAQKGELWENYYQNSGELNPKHFDGYSYYAVDRSTLSEERKRSDKPLAQVTFTKIEREKQTLVAYDVFRVNGELKLSRTDIVGTREDQEREKQIAADMSMFGQKGEDAVLDLFRELSERDKGIKERRDTDEGAVKEEEAQKILAHLQRIEGRNNKQKDSLVTSIRHKFSRIVASKS